MSFIGLDGGMKLKRGLLPPSKPVELKLRSILRTENLPTPPIAMNRSQTVKAPWGMLLNNSKSDCVTAGAMHETMHLTATAGHMATFTDTWAAQDYWLMQGKPWWPFNDGGLDMVKALTTGALQAFMTATGSGIASRRTSSFRWARNIRLR